eukprot:m.43933 g.43933  ORF g.43933 m.43933 type:complete len:70 (+) comp14495_c0_seq2:132-341(+)
MPDFQAVEESGQLPECKIELDTSKPPVVQENDARTKIAAEHSVDENDIVDVKLGHKPGQVHYLYKYMKK